MHCGYTLFLNKVGGLKSVRLTSTLIATLKNVNAKLMFVWQVSELHKYIEMGLG